MAKDKQLSALDRQVLQALGDGRVLGQQTDPLRERCPTLWDWLTRSYVGKDHVKTPAILNIRLGPEGVLATLVDRDLCCSVGVACNHLEDVWAALEAALAGTNPPISNWGRKEPHLRKRKSGN